MCGVQNAHIGTISSHSAEPDQKPRIVAVKSILAPELKKIQDNPQDVLNPWRTHPKLDTFVGSASTVRARG